MRRYQLVEIDKAGKAEIRVMTRHELLEESSTLANMTAIPRFEEGMIKRAGRTFYLRPIA